MLYGLLWDVALGLFRQSIVNYVMDAAKLWGQGRHIWP